MFIANSHYVLTQETEYSGHDQIDLYDDVISPSANNGDAPEDRDYMDSIPQSVSEDGGKTSNSLGPNIVYTYTGKRIALYIGNLTWVSIDTCFYFYSNFIIQLYLGLLMSFLMLVSII